MDTIKLIRNRWFLLAFSVFFFGIIWCSFQLVYRDELLLYAMDRDDKPPDTAKVMVLYKKMIRTKPIPRKIRSFYCLAKVLARVGKGKEEIRVLRKLVRVAPKDRKLRLWLAVELYNQKRYKEAERLFQLLRKVQETNDEKSFLVLMVARNAAKSGLVDKATQRYETYLKEKPGDREAGLEYADYLQGCGRYQDAEARYEKLIELLKEEPEGKGDFARKLLLNAARNAVNNKHEDRAVEYYKKVVMYGLDDPKVYWEIAGLLAKLEKTEEALELCEKVLTFEPQNTEALMLKVNLLLRLKSVEKKKEAIRILRKLVRVTPKDRELRQRLAVELHNQKKYKEAERHFQLLLKGE